MKESKKVPAREKNPGDVSDELQKASHRLHSCTGFGSAVNSPMLSKSSTGQVRDTN